MGNPAAPVASKYCSRTVQNRCVSAPRLKTYILITFINGTVGTVDLFQSILVGNYPIISYNLARKVNIAHLVQLCVPFVSFMGACIGWEYVQVRWWQMLF